MASWRKTLIAFGCLALASTPAAAQYAQPQPYAVPARPYAPSVQPAQPVSQTPPASYAVSTPSLSPDATLRAALESNRRRDLSGTLAYRQQLSDPLARKVVTWAMIDVFGQQLGLGELEAAVRDLQGWPREEARKGALDRARTGGVVTPSGPVPYSALQSSGGSSEGYSSRVFTERRLRMNEALRARDYAGAYTAIAHHGLPQDANYAEAESFAGWLALNKLKNPQLADQHFVRLDAAVKSPVSKARAAYWRGRAAFTNRAPGTPRPSTGCSRPSARGRASSC